MTPSKSFEIAGKFVLFKAPQKAREICDACPMTIKLSIHHSIGKICQED